MSKQLQTNTERIESVKIKKAGFAYSFLARVVGPIMTKKYGVKVYDHFGMKSVRGQHLFISNHTSRIDYFFNAPHLMPNTYNFVVGFNEFYRKKFKLIANLAHLIPKKNFCPSIYSATQINNIIKQGGNIAIFVEGMNSIRGENQPVAAGTGAWVKNLKLPVYYSRISGGFMTCPKFALDERPGEIEVHYDRMFTPEELDQLTAQEVEDIINEKLYNNDFEWNKNKNHHFKVGDNVAINLHTLLYKCPKCGHEFEMEGSGNKIVCKHCGNGATLDDTYSLTPLNDECVLKEDIVKWTRWQREEVKKEIQDPNYKFSCHVKLGMLPEDHYLAEEDTSEIVGDGMLTIDRTGLTYDGTKNGEKFLFHIDSLSLPTYGMCTDISKFYTFYKGVFVEFYPDYPCVEKFFLVTEEMHRLNGGRWQDFKFYK